MAQNAEAQAFLRRLGELPDTAGIGFGPVITPSLQDEAELRRLFATDRTSARLEDPYVGLVDVFGQNTDRIKKIHARAINDDDDLQKHHVMPLDDETRKKDGELSMASSLEDFKTRWAIFSEGALSQLTNWNNVVAAGGSVLACLAPLPERVVKQGSKRAIRKYYLPRRFLLQMLIFSCMAEEKCLEIYNAVRDSVPWDICAIRTKNAVEKEVKSLRRVIDGIKSSGALANKPELLEVLSKFADSSEQEFAHWTAQKPEEQPQSIASINNGFDLRDFIATFDVFSKAVVEVHQRRLIHLRDVQLTILNAVEAHSTGRSRALTTHVEGLEEEEPGQTRDLNFSAILIILGYPAPD